MIHLRTVMLMVLQAVLLTGCQSPQQSARIVGGTDIDSLNVLTFPVAVNLDEQPGADGFAIKLYAGNIRQAKTRPIQTGTLEVLLYDGAVARPDAKPLKTWTFTANQLLTYRINATIGIGYQLALRWEKDRPTQPRFSVVTRLRRDGKPDVVSTPIDIEMAK